MPTIDNNNNKDLKVLIVDELDKYKKMRNARTIVVNKFRAELSALCQKTKVSVLDERCIFP